MRSVSTHASLAPFSGGILVPTMGALHDGHLALIRLARAEAERRSGVPVVVSIYVNPTQFNESSDFDAYPRDTERDLALCEAEGVDAVFMPTDGVVYPEGRDAIDPGPLPEVATEPGLEDRHRPGHFEGVCAVCRRLFALARPAAAIFGEKDWQQLQCMRAIVELDGLPMDIVPGPTVREPDGLALSSRNVLLSTEEREHAMSIAAALRAAGGLEDPMAAESAMRETLRSAAIEPEYAVVRDAETLGAWRRGRPGRALIAAPVGSTRLIDNAPWPGAW